MADKMAVITWFNIMKLVYIQTYIHNTFYIIFFFRINPIFAAILAAILAAIVNFLKRLMMPTLPHSEYLTAIFPLTESTIKTIYSNAGLNLEWT